MNVALVTPAGPQPISLILVSAKKTAVVYLPPVLYAVQDRDTSVRDALSQEHTVQGLSFGDTSVRDTSSRQRFTHLLRKSALRLEEGD